MAIVTRKSAYAVKVESTEGTPVSPTASTDYIPIQADATMSPEFDTLENVELKASIGASKSILGFENPTSSVSVYLTGSGSAGTAPQVDEMLTAAFGNEDVESTEYNTVAASTVSTVKVDTGEGATYRRGQALLVKHPASPYEIRAVDSISGDDLSVSFDLDNAPGVGVDLGLATTYYPADDGHQTLSLWHYLGNGGATQMISGARVTELGIEFPAGELINASYTLEGLEYYFNPIEITTTDTYLDFTDDDGTFAAQITPKFYKDPHDLASALTTAMNATATTQTHSVTYSDSAGTFTIANSTGALLSLLWNTGANTANTVGDKIGFSIAADDTGSTSYASDNPLSFASPQSPSFTNHGDPLAAKNNEVFLGDQQDSVCFEASSVSFTLSDARQTIDSICATSGRSGSIVQSRSVTVSVTALLEQYDVDQFRRFRENDETRFQINFGTKSGGNYEPGKSGCVYIPTATITSFNVVDDDGLVTLELELTAFVNDQGEGEVFLSFV
jgi:hypothetical protein